MWNISSISWSWRLFQALFSLENARASVSACQAEGSVEMRKMPPNDILPSNEIAVSYFLSNESPNQDSESGMTVNQVSADDCKEFETLTGALLLIIIALKYRSGRKRDGSRFNVRGALPPARLAGNGTILSLVPGGNAEIDLRLTLSSVVIDNEMVYTIPAGAGSVRYELVKYNVELFATYLSYKYIYVANKIKGVSALIH